tara:strand:+ start:697 stop:888 length:192 start_codon:yes stop_codon:yes gene_type:complete
MSDVEHLNDHKDFIESRSSYDDMYNELESVLEKFDGLVFAHEKVAALETIKALVIFSECVDME